MSNDTLKHGLGPVMAGFKDYTATPDQLIPLLQYVQAELGFLAPEVMSAIAEYLRLPLSHVYGVATFYAQFRFRPLGRNRLTVCRGTACHVRGSSRLVEDLEGILGIKAGSTTSDMMFSLETVACLGSCALAPAVVINDKVHGKVTTKKLQKMIAELRDGKPAEKGPETAAAQPEPAETAPTKAPEPVQDPLKKEPAKTTPARPARAKAAAGRKTPGSTRSGGR